MPTCSAINKAGKRCSAYALKGLPYCFAHAPQVARERTQARRLGGIRHAVHQGESSALPEQVRSVADVLKVLDYALAELMELANSIPRDRALISLVSEYLHALDVSEIEERLQALEEQANAR